VVKTKALVPEAVFLEIGKKTQGKRKAQNKGFLLGGTESLKSRRPAVVYKERGQRGGQLRVRMRATKRGTLKNGKRKEDPRKKIVKSDRGGRNPP